MNSHNAYRATMLLAAAAALAVGLSAPAHAGSGKPECRDNSVTSTCEKPGHSMSPGAPDLATQQLLFGNLPMPMMQQPIG